ncbi:MULTISPECIES: tape measure protein [Brevibacterium]|uniref:Tape measure domain-containing protein n=1 Tax=Brevibacterium antiquum CNRZ 918 TaxID=1255637 RepID=A0A2H1KEM2_9MICO|nr:MULTISPECIES: tape measure protein [Brevibacterium]SMX98156.1 tape measure domain-containing protein [Brevibacterium antiquum CNRZ 918]HCG55325.1 hypothetical protein [Brevibacterium sp.]
MAGVGANLGTGFVDVVPSMRGIQGKLSKGLRGPAAAAGGSAGKSMGSRMASAAGRAIKTGAVVGVAATGAAVGAALVGGFKSAIAQQGIQATMTGLYDNAGKAAGTLKQIKDLSKTSPIDYKAYGDAANSLAYAGVEGKGAVKILDQVGWAITGAGGGATELDRAMQGLLKGVNNGGVVMNDTLGMISDSGYPIIDGLSAKFGVGGDAIKKMAAEGKLSVEDVIDVMSNKFGPLVGKQIDGGKEKAKTFGDTWLRVKDNISLAIGEKMIPILEKMSPILGTIGDKLAGWIENVDLSPMVGWFEGIGKWAGQLDFSSFDNFTKSLSGGGASSALSSIFDSVKKLAPVFGELFVSVQKSAPAFATLARGGVDLLAGALKFLADHMDMIVKALPFIIGGLIAWRAATAVQTKLLAVQAPILAASNGLRLTAAILEGRNARAKIASTGATATQTGAENVGLATKIRTVAATIAQKTATVATSIATKAAAAGQWLLNAALSANPIGLVIAGIAALVAGLVWFFTKTKVGQAIIQSAWAGIKVAIGAVTTWFTGSVVPWIKAAIGILVAGFKFFKSAASLAWTGFKIVLSTVWNWVKTYVFNPIAKVVSATIPKAFGVMKSLVGAYINAWKLVINVAWSFVRDKIFKPLKHLVTVTIPAAFTLFKNLVKSRMENFRASILDKYSWVKTHVFKPLKTFVTETIPGAFTSFKDKIKARMENFRASILDKYSWVRDHVFSPLQKLIKTTVPNAFDKGVKSIGTFWDKLKKLAAKPVNFVIDTIYNNGIRKLWNPIAGLIGKDKWKLDEVKELKFRTGGKVWGAGTETSDSIPARLSRNEHVLTAKDVRNLGGHGGVYALRKAAQQGWTPGLASGGTLSDAARWLKNQDVRITEFKGWGQNVGGHSRNSQHYTGHAFDANAGPGGQNATEQRIFDRLVPKIHKLFPDLHTIWRAPGHYNHLHVGTGPGGKVGSGGPGGGGSVWDMIPGLGKLRDLKDKLKNMASGRFGEAMGGLGKKAISGLVDKAKSMADWAGDAVDNVKGGITKGVAYGKGQTWATLRGLNWSQRKAMNYIVSKESGWDPKAQNPRSTASGLPQMINSTARDMLGGAPASRFGVFDQLDGMKKYVNKFGGWEGAEKFWKSHHYYAQGGPVAPSSLSMMSGKMPSKPTVFDGGGWLTDRMVAVHGKRQPDAVLSQQQWSDVHRLAVDGGGEGRGGVNLTVNINGDIDSRATAEKVVDDLSFEVKRIFRGGKYL